MKSLAFIAIISLGVLGATLVDAQQFTPGLDQKVQGPALGGGLGGLGFSLQVPNSGWPELGRYLSPFIADFRGGMPRRTNLGRMMPGPAAPASVTVVRNTWAGQAIRYDVADGKTMELVVSRLSPAILLRSSGGSLYLLNTIEGAAAPRQGNNPQPAGRRGGGAAATSTTGTAASLPASGPASQPASRPATQEGRRNPDPAFLRYVAVPTSTGVKVLKGPATVEGADLSEPWLVVWFGQPTPGIQDQDCALLLVLQHRPAKVQLAEREGLALNFGGDSGYVAVMSLTGFATVKGADSEKWSAGLPEAMVKRARQWVPVLRQYPTDVKESYRVDQAADKVTIREEVTFLSIEDDWKTQPRKIAPLPPMLAAAWRYKFPLTFSGPVVDLEHIENAGPYAGIEGVDQYTWEASGLLKYLGEAMQVGELPAQSAALRQTLATEIQKMEQAGHLRPGYFTGGLLDARTNGGWDFWGSPGELINTLSQASALLDDAQRATLREYMAKEIASYPPWRTGFIGWGQGASRELFDIPPEEWNPGGPQGSVGGPTVGITKQPEGRPSFDSIYAMWNYGQATGDWDLVKQGYQDMDNLFRQHLGNYDWALMGVTTAMPVYPRPFGGVCGMHTQNTVLAGLIGYYRLASRFGQPQDRDLAAYVAVRQLICRYSLGKFQQVLQDAGAFRYLADTSVRGDIFSRYRAMPIEQEEQTIPFMRDVNKWEKEVMALNSQFVLLTEVLPSKKYVRMAFLNLVPEVGRFLHDYAVEDVSAYVKTREFMDPYWFVPRSPETRGESCPAPYSQNWDLFQAKALVLGEPAEKLQQYLQVPISLGDLYYLQNLTATMRAAAGVQWKPVQP